MITFFLGLPLLAQSQVKAYPIDSWHSNVAFSARLGGLLPVKGNFDKFWGTVLFDEKDLMKTSATVLIDASSISTGVEMRDTHLESADFFDVENYPNITFSSDRIIKQGTQYFMAGNLTMHGVSKEVQIPFDLLHGEQADPWKNFRITFEAVGEINRLEFGIGEGGDMIGETVEVQLILSGRVFNTETINLFKRPFGIRMVDALEKGGIDAGRKELSRLSAENDKDANKQGSFNFIYLRLKQTGKLKASLQAAKLAVEVFPEDAEARSLLAYAYYENGEMEKALKAFREALALDENDTLAIEMLKWLESQ